AGEARNRTGMSCGRQTARMKSGEREALVRQAGAEPLDCMTHSSTNASQIGDPVGAAPDLVPIDHESGAAAQPQRQPGAEQREVGKGSAVHHVVALAVPEQMPEDSGAEAQRRPDSPAPLAGVEVAAG